MGVTSINGTYFCKIRLINGGSFEAFTNRCALSDTSVLWNEGFNFEVKLVANSELKKYEDCLLRISVRKELKGGKTFQKLGYVDYNLTDFINKSEVIKRVLKGYDDKTRYDNSYLKIKLECIDTDGGMDNQLANSNSQSIEVIPADNFSTKNSQSLNLLQVPGSNGGNKSINGHSRTSSKGSSVSFGHQR